MDGRVPRLVWYAFAATTLYDLGTHITTTFKDISRDRQLGILTTPLQIGIRPALFISAVATVLAFAIALLPYWLEPDVQKSYIVWIILGVIATVSTRISLYLEPTEKNGYFALKGSMVGSILFFPCLIGAQVSIAISAAVIVPLLAHDTTSVKNNAPRGVSSILLAQFAIPHRKEMITLEHINLPNVLVIIAVFMVSMLTACAIHSGEVHTFAKIAKDIEADPGKSRNTYVGRVVNIRAKAGSVARLRAELLEDSSVLLRGDGLVGSNFVSFWVTYRFWVGNEPFRPDKFFHPEGGSEDLKSYLFKVRIKSIDQNMAPGYWTVWTEILE